jgi:hypothetical protein
MDSFDVGGLTRKNGDDTRMTAGQVLDVANVLTLLRKKAHSINTDPIDGPLLAVDFLVVADLLNDGCSPCKIASLIVKEVKNRKTIGGKTPP